MKILAVGDFQGVFTNKLKRRLEKEEFDFIIAVGDFAGIKDWYGYIKTVFEYIGKFKDPPSQEEYFGKKRLKALKKRDFEAGKDVFKKLDSFGKPVIFVFGNTDDGWYKYTMDSFEKPEKKKENIVKRLKNFIDINYRKKVFKEINFVGFGGYMDIDAYTKEKRFLKRGKKYQIRVKKRIRRSEEKLFKIFNSIKNKNDKILVTHYPPYGIFDIIREKGNPMNGRSAGVRSFSSAIKKYKPRFAVFGHMHEYQGLRYLHGVPLINPGDAGEGKYAIIDLPEDKKKKIKVRFIRK